MARLRCVMLDDAGTGGMAASESHAQVFFVGPVVKQVKEYKPVLNFPRLVYRVLEMHLRPESNDVQMYNRIHSSLHRFP